MALASGHWLEKEMRGEAPRPRYGHTLAVAGNVAFLFGGASSINQEEDKPVYFSDFYMLTVSPDAVTWEEIPQSGEVPSAREGHTLCVVKGKLYLFGGVSSPNATQCLPGVYSFDIVSLTWDCLATGGVALRTLSHSSVAVGDNIYVYGGILGGSPIDDLLVFSTVSLTWTPVKTSGSLPPALCGHSFALVGDQVFMFGGYGAGGDFCKDIYVLNTENLLWQKWEVKGESPAACSRQTLTAHHDKDIYLFGGRSINEDGTVISSNDIHKLSIAKMKWKVPLYVGIPPARRHGHTAFILHGHLYVFGGKNEEQEFNDLKVMRLINPSERQPVMKEILSEFGLQGVHHSFTPTKVPNVRYELSESTPFIQSRSTSANAFVHREFSAVRDQAIKMIQTAFTLLDQEFQKLDREKSELSKAAACLQREKEAHEAHRRQQQQELQEMLDRHRSQNEAWLRARAEENDGERRELCRLREEVLQEQERLKEEQSSIQKRSEHLLSIMQQFR
ncbi:kelch domain-containing protein 3-like [Seriola lalandi dorsalis]|uniref:kelch domain-containing protein 3-like n=1 Tax=Seriola lalandi dorsalis TaxID=1841481 RepID=UPI000C6F71E7|nr:kelch domain-containing protein 3-like [Seriola lalandi dorsalis]XP_056258934.1 kelch domain-containing protein 3 [Seriola aureovittata]XP_056258935.1 kelch domain-containing protein 3 [Seriola aureovittata]XP_056258936.1 kelch domain-containing protein 3 [Seriola aureovittata]XP_056258938.1 kelch domain-containing protein 3 [Seriola aureovittata]XP_056258939.1 kelch domain-containing protein 3 [Seriola aureovittata]